MVRVANRVWDHWRDLEARFAEPAVVLLFSSDLTGEDAQLALQRAASAAIEALESEVQPRAGDEEPRTGHWALARVPGGVALRIDEEPSDFERLVSLIVEGLDARGIEGRFDLYQPSETVELPETVDLLECRLRVNGTRYHQSHRNYGWKAEASGLWATVEAGLRWCLGNGAAQLPLLLKVRLLPVATIRPEDDVEAYLRDALKQTAEIGVVHITSAAPDCFRTLAVCASRGRVSLIEGGTVVDVGWRRSLRRLRDLMADSSEQLVYGFVKRGSDRSAAEHATSQALDWPPVPHFNAWAIGAEAFEDEFVPDAFGVQLLGPGHAARIPGGPDWRTVPVGEDRVLLEHADLDAWFRAPFVPPASHGSAGRPTSPIPDVLARARQDFAQVLFNEGVPQSR